MDFFMDAMASQLVPPNPNTSRNCSSSPSGLAIVPFLDDKNIFITGATGFLGKVLVEKILRVQPRVRQLYLLIKAENSSCAKRRLQEEILCSDLFECLRSRHAKENEAIMEQKISVVIGDITKEMLGIDPSTFASLTTKLHVIVNSAATTNLDERYDYALNMNTEGPRRIMELAKSCLHLQLFMHVSTAFAHGKRKGLLHEKTFNHRYNTADATVNTMEENVHPKTLVDLESKLIKDKMSALNKIGSTEIGGRQKLLNVAMKELGLERAKYFGWQDAYVLTKAMGEMVIESMRDDLPTVIVRPSIVESTIQDPFPGWIEGYKVMDPVLISYGKGQLPGFPMDPNCLLDVVPVDMVANAMLAAMAKHACRPGLEVYQVASSTLNPFLGSNFKQFIEEHFEELPFLDNTGKPMRNLKFQLYPDMESYIGSLSQVDSKSESSKLYQQMDLKAKENALKLANIYYPYTFYGGRFDNSNTRQLHEDLSTEEKQVFGFDFNDIGWDTYIKKIHIPGLRQHLLKGRGSKL